MSESHDSERAPPSFGLSASVNQGHDQKLWPSTDRRSTLSLRSESRTLTGPRADKRSVMSMREDSKGMAKIPEFQREFKENLHPLGHTSLSVSPSGLSEPEPVISGDTEPAATIALKSDHSTEEHIEHAGMGESSSPTERSPQNMEDEEKYRFRGTAETENDSILPSGLSHNGTESSYLDNSELHGSQFESSKVSSSMMIERDMEKLLDIETSMHRPDSSFLTHSVDQHEREDDSTFANGGSVQYGFDQSEHPIPSIHTDHASPRPQSPNPQSIHSFEANNETTPRPTTTSRRLDRLINQFPGDPNGTAETSSLPRAGSRASLASERFSQTQWPSSPSSRPALSRQSSHASTKDRKHDLNLLHPAGLSSLTSVGTTDSLDISDLPQSSTVTTRSEQSDVTNPHLSTHNSTRKASSSSYYKSYTPTTPRPSTAVRESARDLEPPGTVLSKFRDGERRPGSAVRVGSMSSAPGNTSRHTLTLKEQNITIDRLTKENFDLKLKIHFLDQALQRRSDEGLGELVQENVQLQTDLANERKESLTLRKRAREAERRARIVEEELREAKQATATLAQSERVDSEEHYQLQEETKYLREQVEQSERTIHKLRAETFEKEVEKRRMAEVVRMMQTADSVGRDRDGKGVEEAMEMWKDLLSAETARREQADEDTLHLRVEVGRLQSELNSYTGRSYRGTTETNTTHSNFDQSSTTVSSAQTLVEKLQHENGELRRDLGAQTSMLTSRNRERERLQAEIEELKLASRRVQDGGLGGRSIAGDSIFERSVSRAGPGGRGSHGSGPTGASVSLMSEIEQERDELEQRLATLRDEAAQTKLLNQDLERELNGHLDLLQRSEKENDAMAQQLADLDGQLNSVSREREELIAALSEREEATESLQAEAVHTVERLEEDCRAREAEIEKLADELQQKSEDFEALQAEMAEITRSVLSLEDERAESRARIQSLDAELDAANGELETLDKRVRELSGKSERLEVQLESHQAEIGFLREEQEADKIKIGGLEAALIAANSTLDQEKARTRELEDQRRGDARQREVAHAEAEQAFAVLNKQLSETQSEGQRLQKGWTDADAHGHSWRERFESLESSVKAVLDGSFSGDRAGVLEEITILQTALADARETISYLKSNLNDRELMIRDRDEIVERAGLELQTGTAALEKEKRALHQARIRIDQLQAQNQNYADTVKGYESRVRKLEAGQRRDKDQIAGLESQLQSKYTSQTTLLLNLWHRLSSLCGTDWAQKNCLIEGQALPTVESINKNLPGFSKNILLSIKTIEGMVRGFRERLKTIERDLWKDYQTLEHAMDARSQKLDKLELAVNQLQFLPQSVRQSTYAGSPRGIGSTGSANQQNLGGTPNSNGNVGSAPGSGPVQNSAEAALRRENLMLHARLAELQQQSQQHNSSPEFRSSRSTPTSGSRIPTATRNASTTAIPGTINNNNRHTNNPSYPSAPPLSFDPTSTVPGHQSRPSIDYTSTSNPPQGPIQVGAGGGILSPNVNMQQALTTTMHNGNINTSNSGPGSTGSAPGSTSHITSPTGYTNSTSGLTSPPLTSMTGSMMNSSHSHNGSVGGSSNGGGGTAGGNGSGGMVPVTQAELARAALCHEFLQQAKEERGLRAMERSNARRRLQEKDGVGR